MKILNLMNQYFLSWLLSWWILLLLLWCSLSYWLLWVVGIYLFVCYLLWLCLLNCVCWEPFQQNTFVHNEFNSYGVRGIWMSFCYTLHLTEGSWSIQILRTGQHIMFYFSSKDQLKPCCVQLPCMCIGWG